MPNAFSSHSSTCEVRWSVRPLEPGHPRLEDAVLPEARGAPPVISFANQKGGAGKTSLACSVAVRALNCGLGVVILDCDPQGSARLWSKQRKGLPPQVFVVSEPASFDATIASIRSSDIADLIIVDTPAGLGIRAEKAIDASDLCIVPCVPSRLDMEATATTVRLIKARGKLRELALVVNRANPTSKRTQEAYEALSSLGCLAGVLGQRVDHLDAIAAGQGVTEWAPRDSAAREVEEVWTWIKNKLRLGDLPNV